MRTDDDAAIHAVRLEPRKPRFGIGKRAEAEIAASAQPFHRFTNERECGIKVRALLRKGQSFHGAAAGRTSAEAADNFPQM